MYPMVSHAVLYVGGDDFNKFWNLYCWSLSDADDVRSLSQTATDAEDQASTLSEFTTNRGLQINANKTEIVALSRGPHTPPQSLTVSGIPVPIRKEVKCLGYWWQSNLGADKSIDANNEKGRKAFFGAGTIGAYQGYLNPLNAKSLFFTCVIPALLYGCENWCLTETTVNRLEVFQSQMGKRMLKFPSHYANILPRVVLGLPSIRVQIPICKLWFLA